MKRIRIRRDLEAFEALRNRPFCRNQTEMFRTIILEGNRLDQPTDVEWRISCNTLEESGDSAGATVHRPNRPTAAGQSRAPGGDRGGRAKYLMALGDIRCRS